MYVPRMMAGLGVGLILGVAAVGTSFASQLSHSSAPVGCASVPTGSQPVGCASHPGSGPAASNNTHTGAPSACPPGLAKNHHAVPVGCASHPANGYADPNQHPTGTAGACPPGPTKGETSPATCTTRPGHGYGDRNHHHTGPPGQLGKHSTATGGDTNPPAAPPASTKHAGDTAADSISGGGPSHGHAAQPHGDGSQSNGGGNGHD